MTRDWETHVYFEHRPLTAPLVEGLLERLAAAGLHLGAPPGEAYPALVGFHLGGARPCVAVTDVEHLLRSREPPVGPGYGVLPLAIAADGLPGEHHAFLTFARPDRATDLDGLTLVVDGALFRHDEPTALDAAYAWFVLLCEALPLVYGWADWETATFLVAAPSRRDVRSGRLPRLMRFNAVRGELESVLAEPEVAARVRRPRRLAHGGVAFELARDPGAAPA